MQIQESRLRVLLVPDSVYWVTGTIAKSIARFNPWIEATIASRVVIDTMLNERPELIRNFDLVHFICPYASKDWLPRFRDFVPCVTSHHHVTDWELLKHNLEGDAIIVGASEWAEDLRARGAQMSRVFCVPYGVDVEKFRPPTDAERAAARSKLKLSADVIVIGFFGKNSSNDDDRKGIDVFSRAVIELSKRMPELAVLIVGPGWQELADSLKAARINCVWVPFVRELESLAEMYHALDFYWVTARVEGGPVTLLEAMSSGVCCLTTPVGLAREIVVDDENAALLPFNDAEGFAEKTAALINNPKERARLCRNGRRTILEKMQVAVTSRGVKDVYAKAFENFSHRNHGRSEVDIASLAAGGDTNQRDNELQNIPLHGFPIELHRRVKMLETLGWAEHLILYHDQSQLALQLVLWEWFHNPFSLLPPRVLLRRFLPVSIVAKIVKLKHGSARDARVLPSYSTSEKV